MDYKLSQVSGKQTSLFTVIKMASIAIHKDNPSFTGCLVWSVMRSYSSFTPSLLTISSQRDEIMPFVLNPLDCRVYWSGVCALSRSSYNLCKISFFETWYLDNLILHEIILYLYSITKELKMFVYPGTNN